MMLDFDRVRNGLLCALSVVLPLACLPASAFDDNGKDHWVATWSTAGSDLGGSTRWPAHSVSGGKGVRRQSGPRWCWVGGVPRLLSKPSSPQRSPQPSGG
jgi:hypothetical protein